MGKNAEAASKVRRSRCSADRPGRHRRIPDRLGHRLAPKQPGINCPRPNAKTQTHQEKAIEAVLAGSRSANRGKADQACGTGKTFTALKLAERIAADANDSARIPFLVPSISC